MSRPGEQNFDAFPEPFQITKEGRIVCGLFIQNVTIIYVHLVKST